MYFTFKKYAALWQMVFSILLFHRVIALSANEPENCFYLDKRGVIKIADRIDQIPIEYRSNAKCGLRRDVHYDRPSQIQLEGNQRSVTMASSIGSIELRWTRDQEKYFGRTPEKALADAAKTASKAVKSGGFPSVISTIDQNWRVIFLDQDLPNAGIPMEIVTHCHPGWMYPPADIFIVAQRVSGGCSSGEKLDVGKADQALARVLLHEIGHGIEFALLSGSSANDPIRAEGFASWFESYAARYSDLVDEKQVEADYRLLGKRALAQATVGFSASGTPLDYGLGFLQFSYLVKTRGIYGITHLYQDSLKNGINFQQALLKQLGISSDRLREKINNKL